MSRKDAQRPDVERLLEPLKGFQRNTVDYVFSRMYLDPSPAHRFLVADEVGLGKTLIARGIIAKAVDHLWETTRRIDVVYICSSLPIASQNLKKLDIGEATQHQLATRLTLLPRELKDLERHKLNFVSFTPATSFNLKSQSGVADERVVLYWLLAEVVDASSGLRNLLQAGIRDRDRWRAMLSPGARPELEKTLLRDFAKALRAPEQRPLRRQLDEAIDAFHRYRDDWPPEHRELRRSVIGGLRMLLARTCVNALEPDLIILDEFQRFRELLRGDDEMATLARTMWNWQTPGEERARVLLLSATPYRMYSTDAEVGSEDHYQDFIATTRFLMEDDDERVGRFESRLRDYRTAIHGALHGVGDGIGRARDAVQAELRQVMVRTERVAATEDRASMMTEQRVDAPIDAADLEQWLFVDELARHLGARDSVELWKSAPYLPQFMKTYQLKHKLLKKLGDAEVAALVKKHRGTLMRKRTVQKFRRVDPANARLRALVRDLVDGGQWQLLWVPPTLAYWPLRGAYATQTDTTKALVFSAWHVVPDVVSAVLSYEVERRMLGDGAGDHSYEQLHRKLRGRLRFSLSDGRLTGMSALALHYPSVTLADELAPLARRAEGCGNVWVETKTRLEALVRGLPDGSGQPDERWYWAAPVLLDARRGVDLGFLDDWSLAHPSSEDAEHFDATEGGGDDTRFRDHVQQLVAAARGELDPPLGRKPDDLVDVLCDLALGAPGILAARSLLPVGADVPARQRAATIVAEGFRTLFNQPTSMTLLDQLSSPEVPYWRACAQYAIDGCLQAVLDEHFHQLWEQTAWKRPEPERAVFEIANAMGYAASIKVSRVQADTLKAKGDEVQRDQLRLRTAFALRYGAVKDDEQSAIAREGAVRAAFNSPYRPFVLASTSIGQEGLDFHPWCHAIVHWNLPGNPVDLEQREGRVHRYEGHAVRKNVAEAHQTEAFARWKPGDDLWQIVFEVAAARRADGNDLVPWWVSPGPHKVQRVVPCLPYSREHERLRRLRKDLVAYRLAFGQPRQQELLELVHDAAVSETVMDGWTLDLRPAR